MSCPPVSPDPIIFCHAVSGNEPPQVQVYKCGTDGCFIAISSGPIKIYSEFIEPVVKADKNNNSKQTKKQGFLEHKRSGRKPKTRGRKASVKKSSAVGKPPTKPRGNKDIVFAYQNPVNEEPAIDGTNKCSVENLFDYFSDNAWREFINSIQMRDKSTKPTRSLLKLNNKNEVSEEDSHYKKPESVYQKPTLRGRRVYKAPVKITSALGKPPTKPRGNEDIVFVYQNPVNEEPAMDATNNCSIENFFDYLPDNTCRELTNPIQIPNESTKSTRSLLKLNNKHEASEEDSHYKKPESVYRKPALRGRRVYKAPVKIISALGKPPTQQRVDEECFLADQNPVNEEPVIVASDIYDNIDEYLDDISEYCLRELNGLVQKPDENKKPTMSLLKLDSNDERMEEDTKQNEDNGGFLEHKRSGRKPKTRGRKASVKKMSALGKPSTQQLDNEEDSALEATYKCDVGNLFDYLSENTWRELNDPNYKYDFDWYNI